jgi:hypothetical protein
MTTTNATRVKLTTQNNVNERVNRCAKILDKHDPKWFRKVKFNILDLSSTKNCVFGQLFGDVEQGILALGLKDKTKGDPWTFFGIDAYDYTASDADENRDSEYFMLEEAWKNAIRTRKEAAKPIPLAGV